MLTGTVKIFMNSKGYGFIIPQGGGEDVLVHYSVIQSEDKFRRLEPKEIVQYEAVKTDKGTKATVVYRQGSAPVRASA